MKKHLLQMLLVLIVVVAAAAPGAVQAQGDLTAEQQALLDRATNAMIAVKQGSYVVHHLETESTTMMITIDNQQQSQIENVTTDTTISYIPGEGTWNVQEVGTVEVSGSDNDLGEYAYTLTAEVRLVDGVVYVNATRESENEASLPPMPEGWVVVDDPEAWPALEKLSLDDWLKDPSRTGVFDYPELVALAVTDVTAEPITLEDGSSAEAITLILSGEGLKNALIEYYNMNEDADPAATALYGNLNAESEVSLTLTLDANDQLVTREGTGLMTVTGLDMSEISAEIPAGAAFLDLNAELGMTEEVLSVGETLTPAEAPEGM